MSGASFDERRLWRRMSKRKPRTRKPHKGADASSETRLVERGRRRPREPRRGRNPRTHRTRRRPPGAARASERGSPFRKGTAAERERETRGITEPTHEKLETLTLGRFEMDCWYYSPSRRASGDVGVRRCRDDGRASVGDAGDAAAGRMRRRRRFRGARATTKETFRGEAAPSSTPACDANALARRRDAKLQARQAVHTRASFASSTCAKKDVGETQGACPLRHPGDEIYRQPRSVDKNTGEAKPKPPCSRWTAQRRVLQNLCLLSGCS